MVGEFACITLDKVVVYKLSAQINIDKCIYTLDFISEAHIIKKISQQQIRT